MEGIFLLITAELTPHSCQQKNHLEAIQYLASPSLKPRFADEILGTLIEHGQDGLAIAYYQSVGPPLREADVMCGYFTMLCKSSVTDAYMFARSQVDSAFFGTIIEEALYSQRLESAVALVDLPMTSQEAEFMEEFLLNGKGRDLKHAADVVVMRKVATGKLMVLDADIKRLNVTRRSYGGISWQNVVEGINRGLGPRTVDTTK